MKPVPILLFGRDFWSRVIDFEVMAEEGLINADDLGLFHWVESAEQAWTKIVSFYELDGG